MMIEVNVLSTHVGELSLALLSGTGESWGHPDRNIRQSAAPAGLRMRRGIGVATAR
jgi:hypothetical protein